jgi:hypothetical protein
MIRNLAWTFSVAFLFLAGCSNNANTNEGPDTLTAITEEDPEGRELEQAQSAFPKVFDFFKSNDPSFSIDSFFLASTDSLELQPTPIDTGFISPYKPYLIYNADRSKAIDLVTYNYIVREKDGKPVFEEGGPDFEVSLIDFSNNTKRRLLFIGPGSVVYEARWVNGDILLAGGELVEGKTRPVIWKITPANQRQTFSYTDTLRLNGASYPFQRPG